MSVIAWKGFITNLDYPQTLVYEILNIPEYPMWIMLYPKD